MSSMDELYELGGILSEAERKPDKMKELASTYRAVLAAVKSPDPLCKRLASQFVARFFPHFPDASAEAMDAMCDLCEDEDTQTRIQAAKDLPHLCRESKAFLPKIVDILTQLLQSDDQNETHAIHAAIKSLFRRDAKGTLVGLFSQIKNGGDDVRERAIKFLHLKVKTEGGELLTKEAEFTLLQEIKGSLKDCSALEFQMFMAMLDTTCIPRSVTGQTQLMEISATMAGIPTDGASVASPFIATDASAVEKFLQCAQQATKYFSTQVKSTKFCHYLCHEVLPHLRLVADDNSQTEILKLLAEVCMFTSDVEEAEVATNNIYDKLMDYMPEPPADAADSVGATEPEFEFTKVECLLLAYHTVGRQAPQHLTENEERNKDFRSRLQYFSRGVQAYIKKLKELLASKSNLELQKPENKLKSTALKCTTNIQTLIRDLFHTPPIYKAKIVISWKPHLLKKDATKAVHGPELPGGAKKRKSITFEDDANGAKERRYGGARGSVYSPPTGKFSDRVDQYRDGQSNGRGRGGRGYNRGGGGYRGGRRGYSNRGGYY